MSVPTPRGKIWGIESAEPSKIDANFDAMAQDIQAQATAINALSTSGVTVTSNPFYRGTIQAPNSSLFSWVNQGTSTLRDDTDSFVMTGASSGAGANLVARVIAVPSAPWTLIVHLGILMAEKAFQSAGVCFRASGAGTIHTFDWLAPDLGLTTVSLRSTKFNSATAFSADYQALKMPMIYPWLKIQDDNANRICSVSADGVDFMQVHSIGRTDFLTADQVGIVLGTENSAGPNVAPIVRCNSFRLF